MKLSDLAPEPTAQGFPYDAPGKEYGGILPFSRDVKSGAIEFAAPEAIRAPFRGAIEWGKGLMGERDIRTPESGDMAAAVAGLGGLRAAPGGLAGKLGPGTAQGQDGVLLGGADPARLANAPALAARKAGYVLPPPMVKEEPGMAADLLAGWGGKIKLQQQASVRNQQVTNGLAAKALGLPEDTLLSENVFAKLRKDAGKAYEAVAQAVPEVVPDQRFRSVVGELGGRMSQAAQHFPELLDNPEIAKLSTVLQQTGRFPTQAGLDLVRELRFQATGNLKAPGAPLKHSLGLAQRDAANAVDTLIERSVLKEAQRQWGEAGISAAPDPKLISLFTDYLAARRLIAKSHDVEGATNFATGDVRAAGLARLADKGRPLTDELRTIAETAAAFPRAMQDAARFGGAENHSALDFFGSALALAHGRPGIAGAIVGRPVARSLLLSDMVQNQLMLPPTGPQPSAVLQTLGLQ